MQGLSTQDRAIEARTRYTLLRAALLGHEENGPQISTQDNDALRCELSRALDMLRPVAHPEED